MPVRAAAPGASRRPPSLPPDSAVFLGTVVLLVRNSTPHQVDNERAKAQREFELALRAQGYEVVVLDEQGTSGADLAKRPKAQSAIAGVESGKYAGIAYLDIGRATRDQDGIDARIFKRVCRKAGVPFFTRAKVYDFRREDDSKRFDLEALFAAWEWQAIRQRMWTDGLLKRAETEPMFRGRVPIGYMRVEVSVGGKLRSIWDKDPEQTEMMVKIAEAFDRSETLNAAANWLNRNDIIPPRRRPWYAKRLQDILDNSIYHGIWRWGEAPTSDLWDGRPVYRHPVPDLAYWTEIRNKHWQRKFKARQGLQQRHRKYEHALLGVLRCKTCDAPMIGFGQLGYRCKEWFKGGMCTRPQTIREHSAFRALRDLLPQLLPSAEDSQRELRSLVQADRDQRHPLEAELVVLREQEAVVEDNIEAYRERGLRVDVADLDRLVQVRGAIGEAEERLELAREQAASIDDLLGEIEQLAHDPLAWFDTLPVDRKGLVCKLLLEGAAIEGKGGGVAKTFKVIRFTPRTLMHSDTFILMQVAKAS